MRLTTRWAGLMVAAALLVALPSAALADSQVWTEWHNALAPEGTPSAPLTLVADGQSDYRIVIPQSASTQEEKAAQDLRTWIYQMTGVSLSIVSDNSALGSHLPISVGQTTLLAEAGLPPAGLDLGEDGYGIAVRDGKLFLWGGSGRGPINAVYALLEEDLGCRWYTASHARIPSLPVLTISPVERTYKPAMRLRDPFYYVAFNEDWSLWNRTNAPWAAVREEWGGHIDYDGLFVHTVLTLVPPSLYFATHPEYYRMDLYGNRVPDQICCTNPDVLQIVTQNIRQTLANNPHTEILEISQMDNHNSCLCPNCLAIDNVEGSAMGSMLYLVNYVAEQIEVDHPDVLISTLAYFATTDPPYHARPRHNVVVRLCNTESWSMPFLPVEQTLFGELLSSWAAVHDQLSIWDYTVNFYHYLAPMPNMHVIGSDIPYMAANNVMGIMTQGGYQGTSERDTMRAWVIAKLMWNPARDWFEMQQDFIWGHFGSAAVKIAEYNTLLHNQYVLYQKYLKRPPGGIRFPIAIVFLTPEFVASAGSLFDAAEALAENNDVLYRVERERLPIMYVKLEWGPDVVGMDYGPLIDRFETVARREGVTHTREGSPNLDAKLAAYRDAWHTYLHLPMNPSPADGASADAPEPVLSWSLRDSTDTTFDIYLGMTDPPPFFCSQAEMSLAPGRLVPVRTYYWQVHSINSGKTTIGPVWRFTSRAHPDFDLDGDVDLSDFGHLQSCITGRQMPISDPNCRDADLDRDNDADGDDLGMLRFCLTGASLFSDLTCLD